MNRSVVSAVLCLLAGPLNAQTREVTLADAIALGARVDPSVVQARGSVNTSGIGVRAAKSRYLPSLTANGSGGSSFSEGPVRLDPITNQVVSGNTQSQSVQFGVSTDLEIFTGFRRGGQVREAQGRELVAEASLVEAMSSSALQTSNDFFSARQSRELVEARRRGVERANTQLQIAIAKLQTRAATVSDSLRGVVSLGEARFALANEEAQLARAEAALARRLGVSGRVAAADDSLLRAPGPPIDTVSVRGEALARAPVVRRTEAAVEAAQGSLSAAKADWWPQLTLSGDYNFAGNNSDSYTLYNTRRIALGVRWPLFNRFQRDQQVAQSQANVDTERARHEDARRQVEADLTTQFAAVDAARQRIELAQLSLQAAQADVAVALERYRLGSITITELNNAEAGLTRAEESAVTARFDYLRAKAQIEAILGRRM